jgi:uncharacterized protein (TIGR03435 family)
LRIVVCVLLILSLLLAGSARAQGPGFLGSHFSSATITRNDKPLLQPSIFPDSAGHLIVKGAPLATVISRAFRIKPYLVVGAPEWIRTPHLYDIEAVPPPRELVTSDETQMLQALLADRFGLQAERVTRDIEIWVLAAEHGTTLEEDASVPQLVAAAARDPNGSFVWGRIMGPDRATSAFTANMNFLADHLERLTGRPVLNTTGLSGFYRISLPTALNAGVDDPATLVAVIEQQTGLVFELRTVSLEHLLITRVEHPQLDLVDR